MKSQRDLTFDIARALCALEIIAFWHLTNYLPEPYEYGPQLLHFGEKLTWGCLACFTFMSGYFLSKYSISTWKDVWFFYKKRLTRFYGMYFIAVLSLFLGGAILGTGFFKTTEQFVRTLLGVGCLSAPYPPTVWYFCMIMFFYLITPFVMCYKNEKKRIVVAVLLFAFLFVVKEMDFLDIDERLLVYYPFYVTGLLISKSFINKVKQSRSCLLLALPFLLFSYFIPKISIWEGIILDVMFILTIIPLSNILASTKLAGLLKQISYASMVAYLFHRHFYLSAVFLYNYPDYRPLNEATMSPIVAIAIVIPLIFVSSFYFQKSYDLFINKYFKQ